MPIGAALIPLLTAGGAVAGGLLNRKKTSTGTQTRTSKRILTPEQQQLLTTLTGSVQQRLANPEAGVAPLRTAARTRINRTARAAGQNLESNLASRGYDRSGAFPSGLATIESGRVGAFGDLEGQLADFTLRREDTSADLASRLLALFSGEESSGASTGTEPGNVAGGAVSGGLDTLTTLLTLDRLMKAGGGGGMGGKK